MSGEIYATLGCARVSVGLPFLIYISTSTPCSKEEELLTLISHRCCYNRRSDPCGAPSSLSFLGVASFSRCLDACAFTVVSGFDRFPNPTTEIWVRETLQKIKSIYNTYKLFEGSSAGARTITENNFKHFRMVPRSTATPPKFSGITREYKNRHNAAAH